MLNDAGQFELLLVDLANIGDATARLAKFKLLEQVVCHVLQLCVSRVVKVRGDGDAVVWLQRKGDQLVVDDNDAAEVNPPQHSQVFDVDCACLGFIILTLFECVVFVRRLRLKKSAALAKAFLVVE